MTILRYPKTKLVVSNQDVFLDVLNWLGFLCATDYLVKVLQQVHGLPAKEARARAGRIIPHVRIAIGYIKQSLDGPSDIAFLPAYYAILNLMKVYILVGPRHADLPRHRWHGATYDVHGKDSHSVLTEMIKLKKDGVFPLFYRTITGTILTKNEVRIKIKDVLPYLSSVTVEYELATGARSSLCILDFDYVDNKKGSYPRVRAHERRYGHSISKIQLKVLRDFHAVRKKPNIFLGKRITDPSKKDDETRTQLNTYLIYREFPNSALTPICSRRMDLPEELPIALLFFYMSSVVRYKPEFFNRLQDSEFWPLLSAARLHAFHSFLLAFWSFMHQENYFFVPQSV